MKGEAAADHRRRIDVVRRYTLAFFAKHLKNHQAPLLDGVAPDPDVIIERWPSR